MSIVALVVVVPSTLSASSGCGTYSFGFAGTRLINDGISNDAGPFAITLPAGTYDISMVSHDNHPSPDYQTSQTGEQWFLKLDSGYVSPLTNDIPASEEWMTTMVNSQVIGETSAISVHHAGVGGVNSVNVVCVGFTPSATPDSTTKVPYPTVAPSTTEGGVPSTTTIPYPTVAPSTTEGGVPSTTTIPYPTVAPSTTEGGGVTTTVPGGTVAPSTTAGGGVTTTTAGATTVAPSTTAGGGVTTTTAGATTVAPSTTAGGGVTTTTAGATIPPASVVNPSTTAVLVEVKPAVELPQQLARTGLTSTSLVIIAMAMLSGGGALTSLARHRED
ncbi:MAG: hypothetical protein HKN94_16860 [Acidimicrobiales bacterium]|nr:hypothetical protein [Acidimicrobiales bacterium]